MLARCKIKWKRKRKPKKKEIDKLLRHKYEWNFRHRKMSMHCFTYPQPKTAPNVYKMLRCNNPYPLYNCTVFEMLLPRFEAKMCVTSFDSVSMNRGLCYCSVIRRSYHWMWRYCLFSSQFILSTVYVIVNSHEFYLIPYDRYRPHSRRNHFTRCLLWICLCSKFISKS